MEKTREEFIAFVRQAVGDKKSSAFEELYLFLISCFVRADHNLDGKVTLEYFDPLIEEAAALPRRYGYAPKTTELFPSGHAERMQARAKMFGDMDTRRQGYITLQDWILWATGHISAKVHKLPKDYLGGSASDVTKDEFITFIKKAVNRDSEEYRLLYFFLLKNFENGDVERKGRVDLVSFDRMIEDAAAAPRRFGLAPKSENMYKNERERLAKRKEIFKTMDVNNDGTITFNEWLEYAITHITGKIATL